MSKRELIDTGTDKRYVRRDDKGQFKERRCRSLTLRRQAPKGKVGGKARRGR